jgi:hypothetical protein
MNENPKSKALKRVVLSLMGRVPYLMCDEHRSNTGHPHKTRKGLLPVLLRESHGMGKAFEKAIQLVFEHQDGLARRLAIAFVGVGDVQEAIASRGLAIFERVRAAPEFEGLFVEGLGFALGFVLGTHGSATFQSKV